MPIDGGEHVVRASAPGMEPFATTLVLANEGDAQTIEIPPLTTAAAAIAAPPAKMPLTAAAIAAPAALNSTVGSTSEKRNLRRTLAWTIGAAGIAQLGIAGYFGLHAVDEHRRSNDLCPGGQCTSQLGVDLNNDAGRAADAATVLTVTGLVGVAVGVYLLVTSHETSTAIAASPNLLVTISANGPMVALGNRF
jgi:hypothetical protein